MADSKETASRAESRRAVPSTDSGSLMPFEVLESFSPVYRQKKGPGVKTRALFKSQSGGDLRSHTVSHAVSSALEGLTAVFGMGTGVTPPPGPPET